MWCCLCIQRACRYKSRTAFGSTIPGTGIPSLGGLLIGGAYEGYNFVCHQPYRQDSTIREQTCYSWKDSSVVSGLYEHAILLRGNKKKKKERHHMNHNHRHFCLKSHSLANEIGSQQRNGISRWTLPIAKSTSMLEPRLRPKSGIFEAKPVTIYVYVTLV
jgi:hypothetical protein